jgi:hypothetical protein
MRGLLAHTDTGAGLFIIIIMMGIGRKYGTGQKYQSRQAKLEHMISSLLVFFDGELTGER